MGKKPLVPGILVTPMRDFSFNGRFAVTYSCRIADDSVSNPYFYSNPALQEVLKDSLKRSNIDFVLTFGNARISYIKKDSNRYEEVMYPVTLALPEILGGMGVATHLQKIALQDMIGRIKGDFTLIPFRGFAEEPYRQRLNRRGVKLNQAAYEISAKRMLQLINEEIRRYNREHRESNSIDRLLQAMERKRFLARKRWKQAQPAKRK